MSHETQVILDRVVLVKVDANIYGARKKLKKEDLVLADGSKLPPEDLASLGSKRLLDPDKLTVFNRLKKEAERICLRVGTRFLGGFAVPVESAASITAELERIALDFAAAKTEFIAGYDAAVTDWVVRHPEFAGIIEQAVDSVEFVSTRLSFDFLVVSVGLPEGLPPADIARLDSKIGSLSEQMFYEISVEANQLIEQSLLGKEQVTRNALRPIRRMRDKLDGLGFLDHRVAPVVSTIDDLLARIPTKGAIEGGILQEIMATAMLLSDPDKTRRHGEGLLVNQTPVVEETDVDEIVDHAELEPPTVLTATTVAAEPTPLIVESVSDSPDFTDLFDGIFDDELEADSAADDWAIEVLLDKSQASLDTVNFADESNHSENSATPETVIAGSDDEADDSDQDYWF
ncbi:DUF3150 domain-containing protein [Methylomonas fluvii]|uniref:DUF3150 domain-containing protein n=1 Tax=Methylomonas fluvii TaxID=1854564 RepID=A0ABR9DHL8_9GAMM|nr:DUF3150 domain-containing protein [Methylomonas fluvii]MBD9362291.1 DUF3150 domain-containing protein [Methylomonas fluvii]CAD6875357.1 Cobalamine biosynthesis protein [Methylomonas fluvii]